MHLNLLELDVIASKETYKGKRNQILLAFTSSDPLALFPPLSL
jgi:hypothetical protein